LRSSNRELNSWN